MTLPIPSWVDFGKLSNHPSTTGIKNFDRDKLLYFLSLFVTVPLKNKKLLTHDFYFPLYSRFLQKYANNYLDYLDFLITHKIIERNSKGYSSGNFSKTYRLTIPGDHRNKPRAQDVEVISPRFSAKLSKEKNKQKDVKELHYITRWLEMLTLDRAAAEKYIEDERKQKMSSGAWDIHPKTLRRIHPVTQEIYAGYAFDRIEKSRGRSSVDLSGERLYTCLTNLKSDHRQFVKYKGEPLLLIDIKNSQPYLSLALFEEDFWTSCKSPKSSERKDKEVGPGTGNYQYKQFWKGRALKYKIKVSIIIMLIKELKDTHYQEVEAYKKHVVSGTLYEHFAETLSKKHGEKFERAEAKIMMLIVFFGKPGERGPNAKFKKAFAELFPNIYKVFSAIKAISHVHLAWLLQQLESYLVLRVIAKRISSEHPHIPIFTIHDSILTTSDYIPVVENVMKEELQKFITHTPSLLTKMA